MSAPVWTLERAKNAFSAVVAAAERGEPQLVTKRGKPVVYVLSVEEYGRLRDEEQEPEQTFADFLLSAPKVSPGVDVDELFSRAEWSLRDVDFGEEDEEARVATE